MVFYVLGERKVNGCQVVTVNIQEQSEPEGECKRCSQASEKGKPNLLENLGHKEVGDKYKSLWREVKKKLKGSGHRQ